MDFEITAGAQSAALAIAAPRIDALIESVGAPALRLPQYSPDYNPIEMAISKIKAMLRKLSRRTVDGLFCGIAEALECILPGDALNYILHFGDAKKLRKSI